MEPKFKVDDTVRLKSGSVVMTIDTVNRHKVAEGKKDTVGEFNGTYDCIWYIARIAYFNTYREDELVLMHAA